MQNLLIITQKVDKNDQLLGFFIDWIARFAEKFDKVTVLCLEKGEFNLSPNVRVISLGKDKKLPKLFWLFNFYKYLFQYRRQYAAVLIHMNPVWVVLGGWYWHLVRKKIFFWYTSGGVTLKLKIAEKFADTIFTASSESFRLPSKKVIVTGHGIDTELFKPDPNKLEARSYKLRLLSVGRIAPVKNYGVLVDAAKILKDKDTDFSITMIGEAPPLKKDQYYVVSIKDRIKKLGLEDKFNFAGKINHKDLPRYYQSHDVFIHLSKTGSSDKTILEAMACGMKVLSSNDSARTFLPAEMVFAEDNAVELAHKIQSLGQEQSDRNLREYAVKNHNLDNLIGKISEIIRL